MTEEELKEFVQDFMLVIQDYFKQHPFVEDVEELAFFHIMKIDDKLCFLTSYKDMSEAFTMLVKVSTMMRRDLNELN
jgi:hypothetical protein